MLTEKQYQMLRKIRDSAIQANNPDGVVIALKEFGYVRPRFVEYTEQNECQLTYLKTFWVITPHGIAALEEFEHQVHKKHTKQDENQKMVKEKHVLHRIFSAVPATVIAIIGSAVGGLIVLAVEHWDSVVSFFTNLH